MRTTRAIFHLHSIPSEETVSVHFVEHIETQTDRQNIGGAKASAEKWKL